MQFSQHAANFGKDSAAMDECDFNQLPSQFPPLTPLSSSASSASFSPISPAALSQEFNCSSSPSSSDSSNSPLSSPIPQLTSIIQTIPSCSSSSLSSSSGSPTSRRAIQQKYDRARRKNIRVQFEDLRKTLQDAQALTKTHALTELLPSSDLQLRSKFAKKSRNRLENCSTIDLLYAAQRTIKRLNEMKEQMEKELGAPGNDGGVKAEASMESTDEENNAEQDEENSEADWSPTHGAIQPLRKRKRLYPIADQNTLDEIRTLFHSVRVVSHRYAMQVQAVRDLENHLPRHLLSNGEYFGEVAVLGLNGEFVTGDTPAEVYYERCYSGEQFKAPNNSLNQHLRNHFREPHLLFLHALCYVLANGFKYLPSQPFPHHQQQENMQSPDKILQLFYDTAHLQSAPSSSQSSSSSSSSLDDVLPHPAHPLSRYGLPARSVQILTQCLAFFVQLGEEEYLRTVQLLRPVAAKVFPLEEFEDPSSGALPESLIPPSVNLKEAVFDETTMLEYSDVMKFHELYSGKKDLVSFQKRKSDSGKGPPLSMDIDLFFIRDSYSGLPVSHMTIARKF